MKNNKTKLLVENSLYIALVFVAAQVINIPTAIGGVINLADAMILTISLLTTYKSAGLVAGTGSFLAEVFSPYAIFAPATLIIKSLMGVTSNLIYIKLSNLSSSLRMIIGFVLAELIMIVGYFIYQAFVLNLGVIVASSDIPNNIIQALASVVIALVLSKAIALTNIKKTKKI